MTWSCSVKLYLAYKNTTIEADTREYVAACSVRSKASHCPPAGQLFPLPMPGWPWSHIALDFVTGLPPSQGNDKILTIVDQFSKSVHFIALSKLPTACETADLLTRRVFHLHGIPTDLVSDRGPQFTSKVTSKVEGVLSFTRSNSEPFLWFRMVKRRGRIRTWKLPCAVLRPRIRAHGVHIWPGWSTPITLSPVVPQGGPLLKPFLATFAGERANGPFGSAPHQALPQAFEGHRSRLTLLCGK